MDFHCDGKVNYSEFLAATISTINFNKEEKLWSAFKYFDTTDSGYITLDSVMDALKDSGVIIDEEGLKKTFNELQKKGKKINFNEFKEIALGSIAEDEHEYTKDIKDSEQNDKNKKNLKLNIEFNNKNKENEDEDEEEEEKIKKIDTIGEEKKESQDIFFEKVNLSTNNMNNDNNEKKNSKEKKENNDNKENNANSSNKHDSKDNNKNGNSKNDNNDNANNKANSKSNSKNNNKSNSKSNNKSSKSYKSSKSNNKSNKSNVDVLIEEHSIDNNDRFTEVNENQD